MSKVSNAKAGATTGARKGKGSKPAHARATPKSPSQSTPCASASLMRRWLNDDAASAAEGTHGGSLVRSEFEAAPVEKGWQQVQLRRRRSLELADSRSVVVWGFEISHCLLRGSFSAPPWDLFPGSELRDWRSTRLRGVRSYRSRSLLR